ncbi:hypothetical protein GGI21_002398 [Coemansia aciculifera]|nr:hypothetical protein GGI21_002398 [Coemansia aciculifera]
MSAPVLCPVVFLKGGKVHSHPNDNVNIAGHTYESIANKVMADHMEQTDSMLLYIVVPGVVVSNAPVLAPPTTNPVSIRRKKLSKAAKAHLPRWMVIRKRMMLSSTAATTFANKQLALEANERTHVITEAKRALTGIPAPRLQSMGHAFIGLRITDSRG